MDDETVQALGRTDRLPRRVGQANIWEIAAVAVAIVTRLGRLDLVEFKNDESWALSVASSIARGQTFPLVGIGSSIDVPNAPFFVYLLAIPESVSRDPALATGLIGLLGTAAVAATYYFAAYLFDRIVAAGAALLYAVCPWGIIFSRKVWEQDALPLFVTVGFWALFASLLSGRRILIAPGVLLLTLATQLHPTAFFLAVPAAVLVVGCVAVDWPRVGPTVRGLGVGVLAAAIVEAPFVAWQIANGWPTLRAARRLASGPSQIDLSALRLAGSVVVGSGYPTLAMVDNLWRPASFVEGALLLAGLLLLIYRAAAGLPATRFAAVALLSWLVVPVLAQTRHSVPVYPHYFIVLYPVGFVLMGVAVAWLWKRRATRWAVGASLAIPLVLGGIAFQNFLAAIDRGAVQSDFGIPLGRQEALLETANDLAAGGPVYFGTHDSLAPTLTYLSNAAWRIFDDRRGLRLPASDTASVLVMSDPTTIAGQLASRWLRDSEAVRVPLTDRGTATLYRLAPEITETAPGYRALNVPFEDGLTLSGFRAISDPSRRQIVLDLHWRFSTLPPPKPPTVFNHLLDKSGATVAAIDGLAYDPTDWRAGELCLAEFAMGWPTAPGPYHLEVGLYDYPSTRRFALVRPLPGASADALDLGLVDLKS